MKQIKVELVVKVVDKAFFSSNRNLFDYVGLNHRVGSRLYDSVYQYRGTELFEPRLSYGDIVIVSSK